MFTEFYFIKLVFGMKMSNQKEKKPRSFYDCLIESSPWPVGCMWPRMAVNVAQHKIVNLLKTFLFAHQFSLVFVYLMCGPRQLFFFQCGSERPKVGRSGNWYNHQNN